MHLSCTAKVRLSRVSPGHLTHLTVLELYLAAIIKAGLSAIRSVFQSHNLPYTSGLFSIHVKDVPNWSEQDLRDPRNRITLLWDDVGKSPAFDSFRSLLDKKRVLSDVNQPSISFDLPVLTQTNIGILARFHSIRITPT